MTIAAAYLTSEGVVFGADSKTTYSVGSGVVQLLDHAQKIYEIGETSRYALCTFGLGKVGDLSHRTIAAQIGDSLAEDATLDHVVTALVAILEGWASKLDSPPSSALGYLVGGIDLPLRTPRCARLLMSFGKDGDGKTTYQIARTDLTIGTSRFEGAPDYHIRILHGFALGLPEAVREALKLEVPNLPPDFDERFARAFDQARRPFISAGVSDLPLREAIDFVNAYLHVTVKAFKFRMALLPPPCGGPLEIGYISTDRPFRWAKHKNFDSAIRENETWTR